MAVYENYFYSEHDFDKEHMGYKPLSIPEGVEAAPLPVPPVLKPDKLEGNDIYYTIEAQVGESQILPGKKTTTWGYNAPLLGQTMVVKTGQRVHVHLKNSLPVLTSFHWHGMEVPGPITDGGCHAPVYPGEEKDIEFTVKQPAALTWLHAHPCPSTAMQVWMGLAMGVVVTDDNEARLPIPKNYGVDEFPLILQDRTFHDNQLDYRKDYDPMGVFGEVPLINGAVKPFVDVTTRKVRLLFLGGSDRREWRLHFEHDLTMTQIGGDDSFLRHPIDVKKLLIGPGERQQVIVDFKDFHPGDTVALYTDDFKLVEFRIHEFAHTEADDKELPFNIFTPEDPDVNPEMPVRHVTMDDHDKINGLRFSMERIDMEQELNSVEYWDITNTNSSAAGMLHPFHIHGAHFLVLSRNGKKPNPNEVNVYKDTVEVGPGETVRLKVYFQNPGVFMYHCHIIEHEDAGMMAQIKIVDPKDPDKEYKLMDMETITNAFASEMGVEPGEVFMPGMDVEEMDMGCAFHQAEAEQSRRLVEAVSAASHGHGHEHAEHSHVDTSSGASH